MRITFEIPDTSVDLSLNFTYYDPISGQVYYDFNTLSREELEIYNGMIIKTGKEVPQ